MHQANQHPGCHAPGTSRADRNSQNAPGGANATRRAALLGILATAGFTPPSDIPDENLAFCAESLQRLDRFENPYVAFESRKTVFVIEGQGTATRTAEDFAREYSEAAELEAMYLAETRRQGDKGTRGQKAPPKNPKPRVSRIFAALEGERRVKALLAEIANLEMPK